MLFGDFGQLPPVMDLPLYTTVLRTHLSDLGSTAYQMFDHAVVLDQVMRQSGQNSDQILFRKILFNLRDGQVTSEDWQHLMKQTPVQVQDLTPFSSALYLYPTVKAVVEHDFMLATNLLPPLKLSTLDQMHLKHHSMKLLDWRPSSALHMRLV